MRPQLMNTFISNVQTLVFGIKIYFTLDSNKIIYYAKIEGLSTLRSGFISLHKNKTPIYDIFSGASIAVAACMLILPGFITDLVGFTLLFPFTRKFLINFWIQKNIKKENKFNNQTIDGEIIKDKKEKNDEL